MTIRADHPTLGTRKLPAKVLTPYGRLVLAVLGLAGAMICFAWGVARAGV